MFHIVILIANNHVIMSPNNLINIFYYNTFSGKKTSFSHTYIYCCSIHFRLFIMVFYSHYSQVWAKANIPIFKSTKRVLRISNNNFSGIDKVKYGMFFSTHCALL